jgi:hypothetical protein
LAIGKTFAEVQKDWIKRRMTFPILPMPRLRYLFAGLWLILNAAASAISTLPSGHSSHNE